MVTEERLQELIDKEKTHLGEIYVFELDRFKEINPIQINSDRDIILNNELCRMTGDKKEFYDEILLENLYETKSEAQWVAKMHTERTEKFCPPTWEEFEREHKPYCFISKKGLRETIYIFDKNIHNKLLSSGSRLFGKPTKENYEKAVLYAKALFEGRNEND